MNAAELLPELRTVIYKLAEAKKYMLATYAPDHRATILIGESLDALSMTGTKLLTVEYHSMRDIEDG